MKSKELRRTEAAARAARYATISDEAKLKTAGKKETLKIQKRLAAKELKK